MRNDIHLYETLYWVSPIPSTGCTRVRSFRVKPYIKDLFCSIVLSETGDYMIRLSETQLEKKNVKLNNIRMFYNISGVK